MNLHFLRSSKRRRDFRLIGTLISRYKIIYIIILAVIASFEAALIVRGFMFFDFSKATRVIYFVSYWALFLGTAAMILFLVKSKSEYHYSIALHIYSVLIVIWSVVVSALDMRGGDSPIVYLTVIIVIGGIVVLNPIFYSSLTLVSFSSLIVLHVINEYEWFAKSGGYINTLVFIVMAILVGYRHYKVSMNELKIENDLNNLARTDVLTGLFNETDYYDTIKEYDNMILNGKAEFAVIVLDVNGVKVTNDTYGHRFGANLIRTAGLTLPSIFPNSKLFHVGGDEFVGIIIGKDYKDLDNRIAELDSALSYKDIVFEGQKCFLSLAYGFKVYENEESYSKVFQQADDNMYIKKKEIKEKYNIPSR